MFSDHVKKVANMAQDAIVNMQQADRPIVDMKPHMVALILVLQELQNLSWLTVKEADRAKKDWLDTGDEICWHNMLFWEKEEKNIKDLTKALGKIKSEEFEVMSALACVKELGDRWRVNL